MSGIAGIVRWDGAPVRRSTLDLLAAAAAHRGPDGSGVWCEGAAGLVHQALHVSANDQSTAQPCTDGLLTIAADARIDNTGELTALLGAELAGAPPSSAALLLAGYRRWGSELPARLLGDFAFVIWDAGERRLMAARDPMGMRSLYYAAQPDRTLFGTEITQILAAPGVAARISERAAAAHLLGGFVPPGMTFYEGISMLAPGHVLEVTATGASTRAFWRPDPGQRIRFANEEDYAQAFRELMLDAVRCRMRSESPVGVFLSGGVDSGAVAACAGQLLGREPGLTPELRAYSFAFDELAQCDERDVSRGIVEAYALPWTYVPADDAWPLRDEPYGPADRDAPPISWYRVLWNRSLSSARALGTVVVLGGDRGDLVGGESIYDHTGLFWNGRWTTLLRELRMLASWQDESLFAVARRSLIGPLSRALWPESPPRRVLRAARGRLSAQRPAGPSWIRPSFLEAQGTIAMKRSLSMAAPLPTEAARQRYRAIFAPSQLASFVESERMYARHGTCFADPFSDRRITEFVLAIPQRVVNRPDARKHLIRQAMQGVVPQATASAQRKVSPRALGERGLGEREAERIRRLFADSQAHRRGWIDASRVLTEYEAYLAGARLPPNFWPTLSLEVWLQQYWS